MNTDFDGWEKYGLPGIEGVEVRNKVASLMRDTFYGKGIDKEHGIIVEAGCDILLITLTDPLAVKFYVEIKQLVKDNIPAGYSYEIFENFREFR